MGYCITRAPKDPAVAPIAPARDGQDGQGPFPWAVSFSGRVGFADTISELVAILVDEPTYTQADDEERVFMRIKRALGYQVVMQAQVNLIAQTNGDWYDACEWERAVLMGPRHRQPREFDSARLFDGRLVWTCPIPLVLLRTGYAPYSDIEPVEGPAETVWWIDAATEEAFLESLDELGQIRLWHLAA